MDISCIVFSGIWQNRSDDEKKLWKNVQKLVIGNNPDENCSEWLNIKSFWIESNIVDPNKQDKFIKLLSIKKPSFFLAQANGRIRYFWKLSGNIAADNSRSSLELRQCSISTILATTAFDFIK